MASSFTIFSGTRTMASAGNRLPPLPMNPASIRIGHREPPEGSGDPGFGGRVVLQHTANSSEFANLR